MRDLRNKKKTERREFFRALEKITKGVANHRRLEILYLLYHSPGQSVSEIAEILEVNFRTASDHTRKLVNSNLATKRSDSVSVRHVLTNIGEKLLIFLDELSL